MGASHLLRDVHQLKNAPTFGPTAIEGLLTVEAMLADAFRLVRTALIGIQRKWCLKASTQSSRCLIVEILRRTQAAEHHKVDRPVRRQLLGKCWTTRYRSEFYWLYSCHLFLPLEASGQ
jgi:hypothetical protein